VVSTVMGPLTYVPCALSLSKFKIPANPPITSKHTIKIEVNLYFIPTLLFLEPLTIINIAVISFIVSPFYPKKRKNKEKMLRS
jgi:hypothetical protein